MAETSLIRHEVHLLEVLRTLLQAGHCSDVTFEVEGVPFHLHRVILSAQSKVFEAMLCSNFRESSHNSSSICLPNKQAAVFRLFVNYLYTGCVDLNQTSLVDQLQLLDLSNEYDVCPLFQAVSDNVMRLATNNTFEIVLQIFERAVLYYEVQPLLYEKTLRYINANADNVLQEPYFNRLPYWYVLFLLSQDEFCVSDEERVFDAILKWQEANPNATKEQMTHLLRSSLCIDDVDLKIEKFVPKKGYRRVFAPSYNMATIELGAVVSLENRSHNADAVLKSAFDGGYAQHSLSDPAACIVIDLARTIIASSMRLILGAKSLKYAICLHCGYDPDMCNCTYSFAVQVRDKDCEWVTLVDCSQKLCKNAQLVMFRPQKIFSIKIQGFSNRLRRDYSGSFADSFSITRLECPAVDDAGEALLNTMDETGETSCTEQSRWPDSTKKMPLFVNSCEFAINKL